MVLLCVTPLVGRRWDGDGGDPPLAVKLTPWCLATARCPTPLVFFQALVMDASSVKALYRRAQAYRLMDNFDEAMKDVVAACKLEPNNSTLRAELEALQVLF